MLTPVIILNSSPEIWFPEPMPADAMLILPGLALAWAMNSATVLTGSDRFASMTKGSDRLAPKRRARLPAARQRSRARWRNCRRGSFIAVSPLTPSFDHLVRELLDRQRHLKAKRLGGLQIDDKFEFG